MWKSWNRGLERKLVVAVDTKKVFEAADKRWHFLGLSALQVVMKRLELEDLGLLRGKWGARPD